MNSKKIEAMAISAVRESIIITDYLDEFISENDKEPSWDGSVYIYSDKRHIKEKIIGRVAVQVKGKLVNLIGKNSISYPVSTTDLKNYLGDRGIVFFVVHILKKKITERKIYYASLAPIDLRNYLRKANKQKAISITLKEFPSDNTEKSNIFLNCYQHFQKQISFAQAKLASTEELSKSGQLESITTSAYSFSLTENNFTPAILNSTPVYLYAKTKNSTIEQPLEILIEKITIDEKLDTSICIDKVHYYDSCTLSQTKDNKVIKIGGSFQLNFKEDNSLGQFNYKDSNKLRTLVQDLDFFLSILQSGYFSLNNSKLNVDKKSLNLRNFDIGYQKERLVYLRKMVKLFDLLTIKDDIDLSKLTDTDFKHIEILITSFIENKIVTGLDNSLLPVCYINIAKFKILVFLERKENGAYQIFDFFAKKLDFFMDDDKGNTFLISQYSMLTSKQFITTPNIKIHNLVADFQRVGANPANIIKANDVMLQLIKAYDNCIDERKSTFLKISKDFFSWIRSIDRKNYLSKEIKLLNNLQIIRRERDFTNQEIYLLYKITEKKSVCDEVLFGAFLLLGEQDKAEYYFKRLTVEQQQSFKNYPIYYFWK